MRFRVGLLALLLPALSASAAPSMKLWDKPPKAKGETPNDTPVLSLYRTQAEAPHPAVLICPGGGYKHISSAHSTAQWLNSLGISVFILKYRLPVHGYPHPVPLLDAKRALRIVRNQAAQWHLDPKRIGVLGFSSGAHLASTLMTHFDNGDAKAGDPIERQHCRPDFAILTSSVITFIDPSLHAPSKIRLIGKDAPEALVKDLSNELQVTEDTPPTFLAHNAGDKLVQPRNAELFHEALIKNKVPAELHIYQADGHGIRTVGDKGRREHYDHCEAWLKKMKILPATTPARGEKK